MTTFDSPPPPTSGTHTQLRALRGATTVAHDTPDEVRLAVSELLQALLKANALGPEHLLSAIFSATPDIRSFNPATVARTQGWEEVPMLCVAEMEVEGGLPRCIRVLIHVAVDGDRQLQHQYLRDARDL